MAFETGLEGKPWWQGVLVGLVIGALLIGAGWYFWITDMKRTIEQQDARLLELQRKIAEGRAAQEQLPEFRAEVQRLELELAKLLRILPPRRDVQTVLRRFRSLAEQEDFVLQRFAPGSEVRREFYNEWPIAVQIRGTYHNLARFFDRISRLSRIFNVDDLRISQRRGGGNHTIDASFTAKTFVYIEGSYADEEGAEP